MSSCVCEEYEPRKVTTITRKKVEVCRNCGRNPPRYNRLEEEVENLQHRLLMLEMRCAGIVDYLSNLHN